MPVSDFSEWLSAADEIEVYSGQLRIELYEPAVNMTTNSKV